MNENGSFIVSRNTKEKYDIDFSLAEGCNYDNIPKIQMDLYKDAERTTNSIKTLFETNDKKKEKYFLKLLSLSQAGLVGANAEPYISIIALNELKDEIVRTEGLKIKTKYMVRLGLTALIYIVIISALVTILNLIFDAQFLFKYLYVSIGALVGAWVSYGIRKSKLKLEDLSVIEYDMMIPAIRLVFIVLISVIIVLFMEVNLIDISIGTIDTDNIDTMITLQIVVGLCCGLIESRLGNVIYKTANSVIK